MLNKILLFFLVATAIVGCKSPIIQDGERIVLQTKKGNFLSADRQSIPLVKGNRLSIREWEIFKAIPLNDTLFKLTDFENNAVFLKDGVLTWEWNQNPQIFTLEQDVERAYLKTKVGTYLKEENGNIIESSSPGIILHKLPRKNIFGSYIQNADLLLIILAALLFLYLLLIELFNWKKLDPKTEYSFLFLAHLFIAYFAITEFDFLGTWDEQFHALVGKNLSINPLVPKLFTENILYLSNSWVGTEVWLHKPPLFLYQIALSIKLFGANAWSVRVPSMLLMAFMGPIIYRLGVLWFNRVVGLVASLFLCFSFYKIQLLFGLFSTDHNDIVFLFYVSASVWALFEYLNKKSKLKFIAIFLFSAAAIYTKWAVGLFVYLVWGLYILFNEKTIKAIFLEMTSLFKSLGLTILTILPWQIYTFIRFPEIAKFEMELNAKHFTEVVENHQQSWDYYIRLLERHYGFELLIISALFVLAYFTSKKKSSYWAILLSVVIIYLFYGMAATKMPSFTFVVVGFVYLLVAAGLYNLYWSVKHFHQNRLVFVNISFLLLSFFLCYNIFNVSTIEKAYANPETGHQLLVPSIDHVLFREELRVKKFKMVGVKHPEPSILFNCIYFNHISAMFFNENLIAYGNIPTIEDIIKAQKSGRKLLIFDDGKLPKHIKENKDIKKIPNY